MVKDTPTSSPVKEKEKSTSKEKATASPRSPPKATPLSPDEDIHPKKKRKTKVVKDSDSDISVLIDSTPPPQKKPSKDQRRTSNPAKTSKAAETSVPKNPSTDDEIKHLKNLVHKCGVRKIWYLLIWPRHLTDVGPRSSRRQCPHLNRFLI